MTTPAFALLIPVKDATHAKTRLGSVGDAQRMRLMSAFARDAVAAARASTLATVYLVGDPEVLDLGVPVLADQGAGSLNLALARAAEEVTAEGLGVAALLADLPCLRTVDLDAALREAAEHGRSFVADAAGTGTTLLATPAGRGLDPHFGPGSAAAHRASGAREITAALESLRLDVDTTDDLAAALTFGVGAHTARATADLA